MRLLEGPLQLVQLIGGEGGAVPPVLLFVAGVADVIVEAPRAARCGGTRSGAGGLFVVAAALVIGRVPEVGDSVVGVAAVLT